MKGRRATVGLDPEPLLLGIDVSTTATKALLTDRSGREIAVASTLYGFDMPRPLWSEQDPDVWWQAAIQSIREVLANPAAQPGRVTAVGLTGQMHGLVLLDASGRPLRPAILWNDQRTQAQCDEIHARVGFERFVQITGNRALTGFTAPKILWVKENEPEVFARAAHILLPKDYVRYRLMGEYALDKADGAGTVLFDLRARDWSGEILDALEIEPKWLPRTYEGPEFTGVVSPEAAALTGLAAGTPVVAGGGDQAAQAVGVGAIEPGVVALTLGTSGVIFAATSTPLIDSQGRLHAFCHALPKTWHLMGVMLSAGGSLQWYRDTLAPGMGFDELLQEAEKTPPGCEGLLFLPYLTGERTPYPDPQARGAWVGLTQRHARGHLTRAVLEGVAFGLKDTFELLQEAGLGEIRQVRASGGGVRGALWRQILADVLETELVTVNASEGAAYGAALLAGVGAGLWEDVPAACAECLQITGVTRPQGDRAEAYRAAHAIYRRLYPTLKPTFDQLAS
jgi:xylulokinase